MSVKINSLELENVKRIKAVKLEPRENGLTVIGGDNNQGKTSVLDAITWALCGDRYRPSEAKREGAYDDPSLRVTLSNGITVERKGKNSSLKVTDPTGQKAGQSLLDEFVSEFALNLPKFMTMTSKEKASVLLRIIGVEEELGRLSREEQETYNQRYQIGRIAEQKEKYAKELTYYEGVPEAPVSALELIRRQQDILARNGENRRKREQKARLEAEKARLEEDIRRLSEQLSQVSADLVIAQKSTENLQDESTRELEQELENIEAINLRVRANLDKAKASQEAEEAKEEYTALTERLETIRQQKTGLLSGARLPLPELSVEDGELTYRGQKWDGMSGSDQLKVSAAIVRALKPACGFVLVDKLEQMDMKTLEEFGRWCDSEGLQVIATRVSKGPECSVIIEDGYAESTGRFPFEPQQWKEGRF